MDIILQKPVITEKSMKQSKDGFYTFLVKADARKPEIAKAVEDKFSVDVLTISTILYKGEKKMQRNRKGYFKTSGFKKATVTLKHGHKIALFEVESASPAEKSAPEVQEKKNILKGTKVKIEKEGVSEVISNEKTKRAQSKAKAATSNAEKQERRDQQVGKGANTKKKG